MAVLQSDSLQLMLNMTTIPAKSGGGGFEAHQVTLVQYLAPLLVILFAIFMSIAVLLFCVLCTCTDKQIVNHDILSRESSAFGKLQASRKAAADMEELKRRLLPTSESAAVPIITVNSAPNLVISSAPSGEKQNLIDLDDDVDSCKSDNWAAFQVYSQRHRGSDVNSDMQLAASNDSTSELSEASLNKTKSYRRSSLKNFCNKSMNCSSSSTLRMSRSFHGRSPETSWHNNRDSIKGSWSYQILPQSIPRIKVSMSSLGSSSVSLPNGAGSCGSTSDSSSVSTHSLNTAGSDSEVWISSLQGDTTSEAATVQTTSTIESQNEWMQKLSVV